MSAKSNLVKIKFRQAEEIQDLNSDAIAAAVFEEKLLKALECCLDLVDARDSQLNNEPEIVQAKKLLREAREFNNLGLDKDKAEMTLLDNVIPLFPEHCDVA